MFKCVIVIGFGSIGKRHAESASSICESMVIVDPNPTAFVNRPNILAPFTQVSSILDLQHSSSPDDLVIVANWGPDHWKTIQECVDLGFNNFVIEKPITSSLTDLQKLRDLINNELLRVVVNQGWDAQQLGERIRDLGLHLGLGEPVSVWVTGGARCASTAGSHYIHLASRILNEEPITVMAHGSSSNINPRGEHLAYFDGVYSVNYKSGKRLSMSFSNMSSIEGDVQILWRDASGNFSNNGDLTITGRDPDREYANIITRYGLANLQLFSGTPPTKRILTNDAFQDLYKLFFEYSKEELNNLFERHALSNEILLKLLVSSEIKRQVDLGEELSKKHTMMDFRIS